MTAQELNTYINRVLGNSIRCLLPSYWWKRLLTRIVEYVYEVDAKADTAYNSIRGLLGFTIATGEEEAIVYADKNKVVIPANAIRKVNFLNNFYVMFGKGASVVAIDTSMASTSAVTSMGDMFQGCENLTSLDVSTFDTSKVSDMSMMFYECKNLSSLDLTGFDTSKVSSMYMMFYECRSRWSLYD